MEFHQLRYFVAAAEEMSMSRGAERLHVSQPALSRQIGLLEEEIGVLLFERIRKRICITEAGEFFLGRAKQILCDAEAGIQQTREQFSGARRTLQLGFMNTFLDDLVTPVVREFQQRHEKSQVSLFDLCPSAQIDRLHHQKLDAAILADMDEDDRKQFSILYLSQHRMVAVLPENHPLAGRKTIQLSSLASEHWVSLSNESFPGRREFLIDVCQKAKFHPRIVAELETLPLMLAAVATGSGVGIIPGHAKKLLHIGCAFVPFTAPKIITPLLLVMQKQPPTPELAGLIALLIERAKELSDK